MLAKGKAREIQFQKFFKKIFEATRQQDMEEHWDFGVRFDVKMIKSVKRHQKPDEAIHWVEIQNVNGDEGWLYGEADFFSFETIDYWIVVHKKDLQALIAERCKDHSISPVPALYKIYQRSGRQDKIILVKSIDLMYISTSVMKK